jgi:hypothetical protein
MSAIPSTSAVLRAAAGLVIGAWALALPAAARADAAAPDLPRYAVWVEDGRLSVDLGPVPLALVLEDIAAQAAIALRIKGDPGEVWPQAFLDLPLEDGIRRLVGRVGLVMRFEPAPGAEPARRVASVLVHGRRGEAQAAVEPAPVAEAAAPAARSRSTALPHDRFSSVRAMARGRVPPNLPWLVGVAQFERNVSVRRLAVAALGRAGRPEAAGAITWALRDRNARVRTTAIRALGRALGDAAAPVLRRIAGNESDPKGQEAAIEALQALERRAARAAAGKA